ncbi:LeoA/HP0731 family dynamin-like GTPase [uncultured Ferrimonas sp.]|uniref:LeoA/HP0731 family dynamin-like GTPase n=1 Tax=uncultured Ferrimonas sp. TaxID=432640 RepID=UPI0026399CCA|nr:LeoA/HP0731 family dynamin-like GTPase [uncultured Ferrimonas sp.]
MNQTLQEFESSKQQARDLLDKLGQFLQQGEDAGAPIEASLKKKLKAALDTVDNGKLKMALVGGFSEGKTSIAAAWMEKFDITSMNVSHQESSNMVVTYDISDSCELIDTPGLFGFKEKLDVDSAQIQAYKDITKKYVSEAHLLLYVMNPTNPIKASHQDELSWLFRDLNLLSRTVFVLGRFDEVADIEDEWDYSENKRVKEQNVFERLNDAIQLTDKERQQLSVVAVSANPFDMGMSYWLDNPIKFKQLSHIEKLQKATTDKVRVNGGEMAIALEAQNSVISDVLGRQLPVVIQNDERIGEELERLHDMNKHLENQLRASNSQIIEVQRRLKDFIASYFSDLILQVKGTDINTFGDFFEREVGNEGVILNVRIQNEFASHIDAITGELSQLKANFHNEISHYNNAVMLMGKQGLNFVVEGGLVNNASVLAARDGLVSAGKFVGVDLAVVLQFKPWGAVNLAKGINGALVFLGVAFEAWNTWSEHKKQQEFEKAVEQMADNFEQQRKELLTLVDVEHFVTTFFPEKVELSESMDELCQCTRELSEKRNKIKLWREQGEQIQSEFVELGQR